MLDLVLEPVKVALPPALEVERPARIARHEWRRAAVDLPAFVASGLASETMGRGPTEDPLFFAAALAAGTALAEVAMESRPRAGRSGEGQRAGAVGRARMSEGEPPAVARPSRGG